MVQFTYKQTQPNKKIQKENPSFCCIQETHLKLRQTLLQSKGLRKKNVQSNGPKKQARVAILISYKVDFKPKSIKNDKEKNSSQGNINSDHIWP